MIKSSDNNKSMGDFPVVAIGAYEGGVEAIMQVTSNLLPDSGMSYVIAYYGKLADGSLADLIARNAKIPVKEIINHVEFISDHIYIVPDNAVITAEFGQLKLKTSPRDLKGTKPIDTLFTSLAETYKSRAMSVVLSGESYDGAAGIKVVKEFGGATLVQDPKTASFSGMPMAAIDSLAADYILPPTEIAGKLLQIRQSYESNYGYTERENLAEKEEQLLTEIKEIVLQRTGHNFQHYKSPTLRRRIARRMVLANLKSLSDYLNFLRNDFVEQEQLFNDFLIPVTYFFRDAKVFDSIVANIFPKLFQKASGGTLRFWVAGCSTGEEAYSLAICLHEFMASRTDDVRIQIFASDISPGATAKARTGIYGFQDLQNVSESRLTNYFTKRDGVYRVKKVIRDMCVFAIHNLASDTPFTRIDMITCRNVLIYFDSYMQSKVFDTFHYALRDDGFLVLGKSESTAATHLFETVGRNEKFYKRKFAPEKPSLPPFKPSPYMLEHLEDLGRTEPTNFSKLISDVLLPRYAPAYVVINAQQEIVNFQGDTGPFLLPASGAPSFNLLRMARTGINIELRSALALARGSGVSVKRKHIEIPDADFVASIEVIPLQDSKHTVVLFRKGELPSSDAEKGLTSAVQQDRVMELESELSMLREDIRSITEEQQLSYNELQISNEELLAGNEELHVLNEEYQAASEELQSNNEELIYVNDELIDRHEQLLSMRQYAESIIDTIHEHIVVLTYDLRIKSFNPAFNRYFSKVEDLVGRSLFEIGSRRWDILELKQLLTDVAEKNTSVENYRLKTSFSGIGERSLLLNARQIVTDKPTEMILLAIEDITELEEAHGRVLKKKDELEYYNEQLKSFSWGASHDLQEPLRKILTFSQMILQEDNGISEKSRFALGRINIAAAKMATLIRDLMAYTTTITPNEPVKITDLNVLLKKVTSGLKEVINKHGAEIEAENLPKLEVRPQQFKQLLSNLLENSIIYRKAEAPPKIQITSSIASPEEITEFGGDSEMKYIKITVSDNGMGFDSHQSEKIFTPFFKLHSKDESLGSGLGLTLCRQILRNHNGIIKANGNGDEGAAVVLYLPERQS